MDRILRNIHWDGLSTSPFFKPKLLLVTLFVTLFIKK